MTEKEFLYVGHYVDKKGRYILKIGTTNNLERRRAEHIRNYRKAYDYTMPEDEIFHYDWWLPLSKYNTIRYEDRNREIWKNLGIGRFIRNDRFYCEHKPDVIEVQIRKTYRIALGDTRPAHKERVFLLLKIMLILSRSQATGI